MASENMVGVIVSDDDCPAIMTAIAAMTYVLAENLPAFIEFMRTHGHLSEEFTYEQLREEIHKQTKHLLICHAPSSFDLTIATAAEEIVAPINFVPDEWPEE